MAACSAALLMTGIGSPPSSKVRFLRVNSQLASPPKAKVEVL
jgi:hypothetical protein